MTMPLLFFGVSLACACSSASALMLSHNVSVLADDTPMWIASYYHKTGNLITHEFMNNLHDVLSQCEVNVQLENKYQNKVLPRSEIANELRCTTQLSLLRGRRHVAFLLRVANSDQWKCSSPSGARHMHFVREASSLIVSSLLYHTQKPAPETWLEKRINPCQPAAFHAPRWEDGWLDMDAGLENLRLVKLMFDASAVPNSIAMLTEIMQQCHQLAADAYSLVDKDAGFGEALGKLLEENWRAALELQAAQMTLHLHVLPRIAANSVAFQRMSDTEGVTLTIDTDRLIAGYQPDEVILAESKGIAKFLLADPRLQIVQTNRSHLKESTCKAMMNVVSGPPRRSGHVTSGLLSDSVRRKWRLSLMGKEETVSSTLVSWLRHVNECSGLADYS